jgi:hypothetical protein
MGLASCRISNKNGEYGEQSVREKYVRDVVKRLKRSQIKEPGKFCAQPSSTYTEMQVQLDGEFYGENEKCLKNSNRKDQDRNPLG